VAALACLAWSRVGISADLAAGRGHHKPGSCGCVILFSQPHRQGPGGRRRRAGGRGPRWCPPAPASPARRRRRRHAGRPVGSAPRSPSPVKGDLLSPASLHMPVDAVVAGVEPTSQEPPGIRRVPLPDLVEGRGPADALAGLAGPELREVALVDAWLCVGVLGQAGWRWIAPLLQEEASIAGCGASFNVGRTGIGGRSAGAPRSGR
jgi:hypothetical protein